MLQMQTMQVQVGSSRFYSGFMDGIMDAVWCSAVFGIRQVRSWSGRICLGPRAGHGTRCSAVACSGHVHVCCWYLLIVTTCVSRCHMSTNLWQLWWCWLTINDDQRFDKHALTMNSGKTKSWHQFIYVYWWILSLLPVHDDDDHDHDHEYHDHDDMTSVICWCSWSWCGWSCPYQMFLPLSYLISQHLILIVGPRFYQGQQPKN